ncbi:MAG: FUSC family protein [Mycolicibacterium neoaurum]|uniref:FUSC family protein n=1 Tax=Mycolicibacterium neoaurum TaxID=1795 RepID=UPI002FFB1253
MTDSNSNADNTATRPISVAELLARNGSIGAPAPGGRRRRRRGNADAVTVAELTGEIPIISMTDEPPAPEQPTAEATDEATEKATAEVEAAEAPTAEETAVDAPVLDEPQAEPDPEPEPDAEETAAVDAAATDYDAHLQQREAEPEPVAFQPRRRAHGFSRRAAEADVTETASETATAEAMSPDPLLDDDGALDDIDDVEGTHDRPSYLKSPSDTLFGGDSVADEATRRTRTPGPEDIDLESGDLDRSDLDDTELLLIGDAGEQHEGSAFMRGLWVVVQSVLAVALGAGLFIAFDQLWRWNNIVALALSVLVILGLVVGVRVVRKTEDIASTLIAVAVGAMVTLGPLALLQST